MKVWRGFTLTLWVILLTLCTSAFLIYQAAQQSFLNLDTIKTQLAKGSFYDSLRDELLTSQIQTTFKEQYPSNKLVDASLIKASLQASVSKQDVQRRIEPVITSVYRWMDSKEPDINFSISLQDKKDSFYKALETQLQKKIATLPDCDSYAYPPEEALLSDLCLPGYVTAGEATQAVMGSLRAGEFPVASVSQDTFSLGEATSTGPLRNVPTYLNILWVLNLVSIAVGLFLIIILLSTRKMVGVIAVGVSFLLAGIVVWTVSVPLLHTQMPEIGVLTQTITSLKNSLLPSFSSHLSRFGLYSALVGLLLVAVAGAYKWRQRGVSG